MHRNFRYTVNGVDSQNESWEISGTVTCEYFDAFQYVNSVVLAALSEGHPIFRDPNRPCRGPYKIRCFALSLAEAE